MSVIIVVFNKVLGMLNTRFIQLLLFLICYSLSTEIVAQTDSIDAQETVIVDLDLRINAEFKGDLAAYCRENILIPNRLRTEVDRKVYVRFVIETDGSISNVAFVRADTNAEVNDIILKAILKMPNWTPAFEDSKPVRSNYVLPVRIPAKKEEKVSE